jgi:N-acylneuraminate cytidylyltransferase/CMP-N,N'-diacetyllegionaminic acid synthase
MAEMLAIIPARGGSKRLPGKNIMKFCGKPMIAWAIESAKGCKYITRIIVSTDDKKISSTAKKYGAEVPFMRPENLATDTATTASVIEHTLTFLKEKEGYSPDFICLLQPTAPLRTAKHITEAVELMLAKKADACVSVVETKINPYLTNTIDEDGMFRHYIEGTGRGYVAKLKPQKTYMLNGAVYLIRPETFLQEKTFEPEKTAAYVMGEYDSVDIDTEDDFLVAKFIKKNLKRQ